jgi:hypothetical protein
MGRIQIAEMDSAQRLVAAVTVAPMRLNCSAKIAVAVSIPSILGANTCDIVTGPSPHAYA